MARREIALAEYLDEQREAAGYHIDLGGGDTVTMVPSLLFPDDWAEILREGEPRKLLVAAFGGARGGEEQLARFLTAGGNLTIGMHLLYKHLGIPLGESQASSTSSINDGPNSRPTSDASTSSTFSTSEDPDSLGDDSHA